MTDSAAEVSSPQPPAAPLQGGGLRVVHYLPTNFGMTGVETFVVQLAAAQRRLGLLPTIALDLAGREEVARLGAELDVPVAGLPPIGGGPGPGGALGRKLRTAASRWRRVAALRRVLRGAEILNLHAVGVVGLDGFLAAAGGRARVVVTHHTTLEWFAPFRNRLTGLTLRAEARRALASVAPYAAAGAELLEAGLAPGRVHVVPFCVDEERLSGASSPPGPGELRLVMVARLHPGKGHDVLLAALAALHPRHPGLRLTVVGDGPERPALEAEVDRLGLRGVVELLGQVPHHEVPALLRAAHAVVLPSHMPGETFPLSLLEGMAVGLPAIGTRWFGIPDIIADGHTGLLVPPRDPAALAAAIERLATDRAFYARASAGAAARVRDAFTGRRVAEHYLRLYRGTA